MSGCQEVQPNGSTVICYDANKFSSVCLTPDSGMFARMRWSNFYWNLELV